MTEFNKGIISTFVGSFWWGVIGVLYFKYISFVNPLEVVSHRVLWTIFFLFFFIIFKERLNFVLLILKDKKKTFLLFLSGILIFLNWSTWIYAISIDKLVEASFGYYIFPILSVYLGSIFLGEKLNIKKKISIFIIILSIIYMMYFLEEFPWIGLVVAFSFSLYAVLRKIVMVETDIGLFIESIFLIPIIIFIFYNLNIENEIVFNLKNLELSLVLILAGPMTVIPLFLFVKGSELSGLGNASMIFFVAPTGQFLLGLFLYNEVFMINKLIGFILIWFAVLIYLLDLYENN
ncbi:MAG: EamA family transporter RarD [Pelagibacterales bacterium]|nr:EamA family transporter RarD [Pelagibacterales bacterium]